MSYLALARKWRPRSFTELAGQDHVMRALVNALQTGRVHHAFLFTGTRGVGKTTIARILAKSLNCETGMTPTPCGVCSACREIDEGRFVDLIEVDAASRTKVDDTRELLDNVQYAPARGRYKVYLIDEVHMLSTHSFNALLKTLEEPPPHVKFLLATTDPQKLPVTVLSRCLQFNLKRFPPAMILNRLKFICEQESIEFEIDALRMVARAAEGSMRDALSLLDQVIAFGGGKLTAEDTRTMLGTLDRAQVFGIVEALMARDARKVLDRVNELDEHAPDYREVLAELASLLQKLALLQAVPDLQIDESDDVETYKKLAAAITPEDAQLFYQIAIVGRRDLELAPDARGGFEMVLLRMLAFSAQEVVASAGSAPSAAPAPARSAGASSGGGVPASVRAAAAAPAPTQSPAPAVQAAHAAPSAPAAPAAPAAASGSDGDWNAMVAQMGLGGITRQLAANCAFLGRQGNKVRLSLAPEGAHYRTAMMEEKLKQALSTYYGESVVLEFVEGEASGGEVMNTPARQLKAAADDRLQNARSSIENDPNIRAMKEIFGATVTPESIRPTDNH
ncbi:DNA polymerase III subunit gamma/tau [Peristeroidobacter soli]|jgi:DNA polymerase-3 subunit gamma/tau|uniref:DNA polymerase III subunit gamma/tau n=1 Tax=Peristeroidobacter soli TaxID=2497877 RepID=UPI00101CEB22|nr:DNA polymerase III subunit gamma/tau [Peristeroidobacter soli]